MTLPFLIRDLCAALSRRRGARNRALLRRRPRLGYRNIHLHRSRCAFSRRICENPVARATV